MRIAVWHNLPSGGGKRALYDHVRGLVALGHTVEAWCPPTADQKFLPLSSMIAEHVIGLQNPRSWLTDKLGITLSIKRSLQAMDEHCRQCAEQIDSLGFDILFTNACQFFRTSSMAKHSRTPSVLYLQEPFRALYEATPRLWWVARPESKSVEFAFSNLRSIIVDFRMTRNFRIQGREEVDNARCFKKILVNSYFSRESVLRAYGLESEVCYLGVDSDYFNVEDRIRENFVVGLGSFTREKNIKLCIEAIALVKSPKPKLIWIGNFSDDVYFDEVRLFANSMSVDFEALVNVSDDEVRDVLSRATAMLYVPRLEPFGLAPLEANACRVPVIAIPEGGVRETVIDNLNGVLAEPTAKAISEKINFLYDKPEFARQLGINGRAEVIKKWSIEAAGHRLVRKFEAIIA